MDKGDKVILEDTHHNHNPDLKRHCGCVGEITEFNEKTGKYLVKFGNIFHRYWVNPKWLKRFDS